MKQLCPHKKNIRFLPTKLLNSPILIKFADAASFKMQKPIGSAAAANVKRLLSNVEFQRLGVSQGFHCDTYYTCQ
jgi:hypothetical protein